MSQHHCTREHLQKIQPTEDKRCSPDKFIQTWLHYNGCSLRHLTALTWFHLILPLQYLIGYSSIMFLFRSKPLTWTLLLKTDKSQLLMRNKQIADLVTTWPWHVQQWNVTHNICMSILWMSITIDLVLYDTPHDVIHCTWPLWCFFWSVFSKRNATGFTKYKFHTIDNWIFGKLFVLVSYPLETRPQSPVVSTSCGSERLHGTCTCTCGHRIRVCLCLATDVTTEIPRQQPRGRGRHAISKVSKV